MLKKQHILKILSWSVFTSLVIFFAVIISPALSIPGVPRTHVVITGSMEPTIPVGSIVFTQDVDPTTLGVGDIIAFESPNQAGATILHRINTIKSTEPLLFETKGDANDAPDTWDVVKVGVKGKYLFAIPFLGYVASYIRTPIGFAIMIALPALVFIISQILNIKRAIRSEIEKGINTKTKPLQKPFPVILLFILTSVFFLSVKSIQSSYMDTVIVSGVSFSVKDFVPPPVPQLLSPLNDSYQNTLGLVMDWSDVADYKNQHNPVYYVYQSFRDLPSGTPAYTSGKLGLSNIPAPNTPDGTYFWHVKACDSLDNCSAWSETWKVTVDNIAPSVAINSPFDNQTVSGVIPINITVMDTNISHYWLVVQNSSGQQVAGPGVVNLSLPLINQNVYFWHISSLPQDTYTIKLEARDRAGNKQPNQAPVVLDPNILGDSVDWITVNNNIPPSTPTGLTIKDSSGTDIGCNGVVSDRFITIDWDDNLEPDIAYYQYDIKDKNDQARPVISEYSGQIRDLDGVYKYRVSAVDTSGLISQASQWCTVSLDRTPPVTNITNTNFATNNPNIDISYNFTDSNPDFVTLYYSFNLDPWQIGDTSSSSSVPFVASNGDGVYCFDTVGQDLAGNVETGVLPPPPNINPLDPDIYCLTLDNTDPVSVITDPALSVNNHLSIGTSISSWDGLIKGTAHDSSLQGLDHVELSIQKDSVDFWDGTSWLSGSESSVRVNALGTTVWLYQLPVVPDPGQYTIISHAVDKAGNVENSAIIKFIYQPNKAIKNIVNIDISSSYNPVTNYLKLSFDGIPQVFGDDLQDNLSYDLTYMSGGLQKGIFDGIKPSDIILGQSLKSHYIGSCSSGGACSPDSLDDIQFNINLTGKISGQDITIKQTLP